MSLLQGVSVPFNPILAHSLGVISPQLAISQTYSPKVLATMDDGGVSLTLFSSILLSCNRFEDDGGIQVERFYCYDRKDKGMVGTQDKCILYTSPFSSMLTSNLISCELLTERFKYFNILIKL